MAERLGLPVALRDERLTSFEAERRLGRMPKGRSGGAPSRTQRNAFRARIDREAAAIILQDELDARRSVTPAGVRGVRRPWTHRTAGGTMTVRGGRGPRDPMADPPAPTGRQNGYKRTGRYGRGPGDQRRYERYGDGGGAVGPPPLRPLPRRAGGRGRPGPRPPSRGRSSAWPSCRGPRTTPAPWASASSRSWSARTSARRSRRPRAATPTTVEFVVNSGDTPATVAPRLADAGIISSQRAFLFLARTEGLAPQLTAGTFQLAKDLTPEQVVQGLVNNRVVEQTMSITFREGLRIEQMTAKLQTIAGTQIDPKAFYDLAMHPTDALLADYPWLLDPKIRAKGVEPRGLPVPGDLLDPHRPDRADRRRTA